MAIQPLQRLENIKGSFEKLLQDTLVNVDALKIAFPSVPFSSRGLASWAELAYLTDSTLYTLRQVGTNGLKGREVILLAQIACFARRHGSAGAPVDRWALSQVRDKVLGRIQIGKEIDVANYAEGGSATVGTIFVESVNGANVPSSVSGAAGSALASQKDLDCWVLTIELRYTEPQGNT